MWWLTGRYGGSLGDVVALNLSTLLHIFFYVSHVIRYILIAAATNELLKELV